MNISISAQALSADLNEAFSTVLDEALLQTCCESGIHAPPGSDAFWTRVAQLGSPLITPAGSGDFNVTFLWRDPQGSEQHSPYKAVFIDVYSHTPHPTRQPTCLQRLAGTDVWFWQTQLPADWLGSYVLLPAKKQQLPPLKNAQQSGSDFAAAIRNWWIGLLQQSGQADALNLRAPHADGNGRELSALVLPDAALHPQLQGEKSLRTNGKLHHWRWANALLGVERDVWCYRSAAGQDLPLVILLDGQRWARSKGFFAQLDALTHSGEYPPAVYLFIDSVSSEVRSRELTCNPAFWLMVQQELLPVACQLEAFSASPQKTLVAGQSFGGLAALYAALNWPQRFANVLSQSGSFWWPDVNEVAGNGLLTRHVRSSAPVLSSLNVELQIGCYEDSMLGVNHAMHDALNAAGARLYFQQYRGGHDWLCWHSELLSGLKRLFSVI